MNDRGTLQLLNSMNTVIRRQVSLLLLPIVLLICGTPLSHGFELFKSKGKSKKAIEETSARLKEIDQLTTGFADRYVTYLFPIPATR